MLKKIVTSLFSLLLLVLCSNTTAFANEDFLIDSQTEYQIAEDGKTTVINHITIENTKPGIYASTYNLNLENIEVISPKVKEDSVELPANVTKDGNVTTLTVNFSKPVVGLGNKRNVVIEYRVDTFASKKGEVWEISIPRLSKKGAFRNYEATLTIPKSFGNKAYMSPEPIRVEEDELAGKYYFDSDSFEDTGINAGFGQFQVFSFNLNYHLENPLPTRTQTQIALPPDTAFQKLHYDSIEPKPESIEIDEDGNWLANYILSSREKIDITAKGYVQIFNEPRHLPTISTKNILNNVRPTFYWQSTDTEIKELAKIYKTPKEIYDFVAGHLTYDYDRVRPNSERLGAKQALNNPQSAICTEFTDLFIAIARAAGIPAREINGFAYTQNPQIEPLSLVADVLHSWPEYYSEEKKSWIPVDPTWGNTTGGVDFFDKFDLRHFTFVIHGKDERLPYPAGSYKLGATPQKDVFISFAQLPSKREVKMKTSHRFESIMLPFKRKLFITIENEGPSAIYNITPEVHFIENTKLGEIPYLLPFQKEEYVVDLPFTAFGINTPDNLLFIAGETKINISTQKNQVVIYHLLILSLVLIIILLLVYIRETLMKRISNFVNFDKIKHAKAGKGNKKTSSNKK